METRLKVYTFIIVVIIIGSFYIYESNKKPKIVDTYEHIVYPTDTTFYGIITSIEKAKVKRDFDLFYVKTNKVIINSDSSDYSVNVNDVVFVVSDCVKVNIEYVKLKFDFNSVKTTIYTDFSGKSETYWRLKNLTYEKIVNEKN
jgi:hypothetical protein